MLVRVEPDAPDARAVTPVLNKLPCDAAGVATRLSTGREGSKPLQGAIIGASTGVQFGLINRGSGPL